MMTDLPTAEELAGLPKRRGLDRIFNTFDDALQAGKEAEIDAWLDRTDPSTLSTQNITGVLTLTVTPPFRDKLTRRQAWYDRAKQVLLSRPDDSHRVERLIGNLR